MKSTLCAAAGARITIQAGDRPGLLTITTRTKGESPVVADLTPEQAAMLAGEIERAAWCAQKHGELHAANSAAAAASVAFREAMAGRAA